MKGPFERLKYDLRRLWECPHCKRRERSDGTVTTRLCTCTGQSGREGQRTAMKLLEEAGHREVPKMIYRPHDEASSGIISMPPEVATSVEPTVEPSVEPSAEV